MAVTVHTITNLDRSDPNGQMPAKTHRAWQYYIQKNSGTFTNVSISNANNTITVGDTWGIACGALFTVEQETITVGDTATSTGTVNGRIKLHIDTTTSTGELVREETTGTLPALTQQDIAATDGVYELEFCTYTATLNAVQSLTKKVSTLADIQAQLSSIHTQIATKQPLITGAVSEVTDTNLSPTMVVVTNPNGKIVASSGITVTELSYLNNVTSNIQTQFNNVQTQFSGVQSQFNDVDTALAGKLDLQTATSGLTNVGDFLGSIWGSLPNKAFYHSVIINSEATPQYYTVIGRKVSSTTGVALAFGNNLITFDDGTGTTVANIEYWRRTNSTWTRYDFFDSTFGLYTMDTGEINKRVIAKNENSMGYRVRNINVVNSSGNNVSTNNLLFKRL